MCVHASACLIVNKRGLAHSEEKKKDVRKKKS